MGPRLAHLQRGDPQATWHWLVVKVGLERKMRTDLWTKKAFCSSLTVSAEIIVVI